MSRCSRRATGSATASLRPARVVVAASGEVRDGERQERSTRPSASRRTPRRRDQEGVPQARPPVPPGQEPGRRGGGGRASRRSRAPTTSSPTPRSASSTTASARPNGRRGAGPGGWSTSTASASTSATWATSSAASSAAARPRQQPRGQRGADVEAVVNLSFEDSLQGRRDEDPGRGSRPPARRAAARARGRAPRRDLPGVQGPRRHGREPGLFALSQPCPRCRGNGTVIETPCRRCRGTGRERRTKRYTVKIPAGVKDGTRIRLKGKGEAGLGGGPAGDLYVVTRVSPSELYERRGGRPRRRGARDVRRGRARRERSRCRRPTATVSVKIPAGTEDGKLLELKGRGAPKLKGGGKGDLLARVRVTVPKKLSKQRARADRRSSRRCSGDVMDDSPRYMI